MKISILCSDKKHPVYPFLHLWAERHAKNHQVQIAQGKDELMGGDLLFLISCHEIIGQSVRSLFKFSMVVHASDLPVGRGWSPHIWQILEGKNEITVTLLEAADILDSGPIWAQKLMHLEGHELADEINFNLFNLELELMDYAVEHFKEAKKSEQDTRKSTYYRKRTQEDSRIDPFKSIADQFDLLRVSDQERFPAFFDFRGHRYIISLNKVEKTNDIEVPFPEGNLVGTDRNSP